MILSFQEFVLNEDYWDLDKKSYVLYHATPKHNLKSIQKNGIHMSPPSHNTFSEPFVWCADTSDAAYKHAVSRMHKRGEADDDIVVIKFKLDPKKVPLHKGFAKGVYTVSQDIPPTSFLKIIDK